MRQPMDETTFQEFYKNTLLGYSKSVLNHICNRLVAEGKISFQAQRSVHEQANVLFFEDKHDLNGVVSRVASDAQFSSFFEDYEFRKLYKYSVPLFYEIPQGATIVDMLTQHGVKRFNKDSFEPEMVLSTSLRDSILLYSEHNSSVLVKFVLQKTYYLPETFDQIDYRYPVVFYFDTSNSVVEIRFDAVKYGNVGVVSSDDKYEQLVAECIAWLKRVLGLELFCCDHPDIIKKINDEETEEVKIYKQMMELSTGGAAELTASESADYVLPFIGEIRELIDEHEDLFSQAEDIKSLLLQYLADKEVTANYPYIYIKWVRPVESQSYIVRVTFDYLKLKYTQLQHITGSCKNFDMERMNNAIKYLCESGSFVKGEKA